MPCNKMPSWTSESPAPVNVEKYTTLYENMLPSLSLHQLKSMCRLLASFSPMADGLTVNSDVSELQSPFSKLGSSSLLVYVSFSIAVFQPQQIWLFDLLPPPPCQPENDCGRRRKILWTGPSNVDGCLTTNSCPHLADIHAADRVNEEEHMSKILNQLAAMCSSAKFSEQKIRKC
uniref:Uncharacterized protein n=1 Tax=Daphnia galeata TaxID=27404 RepID=A0A8J2W192_9CRUS|nr:unnamed protein product [Daphnia galeata]